ncbi:hypothetical protein [Sphingobacterium allocomposti]|uniref:hypothetical protein n=1 Tax=Sphingobacterium allocomposti TaxID=415956 RepID=UPI0014797977|nr:hypothetical protein [Sphingobacterium composti Yoo et al. 2007 non Ten et al. 2007]
MGKDKGTAKARMGRKGTARADKDGKDTMPRQEDGHQAWKSLYFLHVPPVFFL